MNTLDTCQNSITNMSEHLETPKSPKNHNMMMIFIRDLDLDVLDYGMG